MPIPPVTEEDIKAAEKEMRQKGYNTKRENLPKVRSLHHIDDDDYDELPELDTGANEKKKTILNGESTDGKNNKPTIKD